ncbi:hypothetical protein HJG54_09995 [Leptolyngbya sp. NK1-12]|uniref:Uncharacterized protein n=1 Tax=Leptolyngbya sp. NK1-12 TaxID=2547451 RepID=A0AA96WDA9_9CYAN|nr:hypothetical protein [Leptolyngbya sp. NK1-12]WNZ23153.1 hypothetical protein HJG54_09995 [Leptolyngbya sp. NK1-12]
MTPVEFQAKVENGAIIVPEEYRQQLANGETVKVIVLKQHTEINIDQFLQELDHLEPDPEQPTLQEISEVVKEVRQELWTQQ